MKEKIEFTQEIKHY